MGIASNQKNRCTYLAVTDDVWFFQLKITPMTWNAQTVTPGIDCISVKCRIIA